MEKFDETTWEGLGCKNCHSPFHDEEHCIQTKKKEGKFRFSTRRELNLKPGELPFKFRVEIDPEKDDETEVIRKRSLLRLNSERVYKQMAFAVQAHDAQKAVLNWVLKLGDNMDEKEREAILPVIGAIQQSLATLQTLREGKIQQAVKMEETVEKGRKSARKARMRLAERQAKEQKEKLGDFWVMQLPDTSLDIPVPMDGDNPLELFENAAKAIMEAEKARKEATEPVED